MPNVLVVTGSVRPNSANEKVVPVVVSMLEAKGATVTVANLKELDLPFFDDPLPPSAPEYAPTNENVIAWTKMVGDAEGVLLVTPEYNHTMSPVQLNAIDWVSKEWEDKPVALVGYGWRSGASQAHATAREALAVNLKAKVGDDQANLFFMKELNPDGSVADQEAVDKKVGAAIDELLAAL
jgi:NAD(P)H-dependent FMN reductase